MDIVKLGLKGGENYRDYFASQVRKYKLNILNWKINERIRK